MLKLFNAALDAQFAMMAAVCRAVPGMLGTKIGSAGIVGKLLSLAGLGDLEIGTVAMMVLALAVVTRRAHDPHGAERPATSVSQTSASIPMLARSARTRRRSGAAR